MVRFYIFLHEETAGLPYAQSAILALPFHVLYNLRLIPIVHGTVVGVARIALPGGALFSSKS